MRKFLKITLTIFLLSLNICFAADKNDIDISSIGIGASAMGRGGWYSANSIGADAGLLNPSGLGQISKIKATTMYASLVSEFDYLVLSGILPLGNFGTIALSYISAQTDAGYSYDSSGTPGSALGDYKDSIIGLSYGFRAKNLLKANWTENLYLGTKLKFYQKGWADSDQATGFSLDIGANYQVNKWVNLGALFSNVLFNQVEWDSGLTAELPPFLKLGFLVDLVGQDSPMKWGNQKISIGSDFDMYFSNERTWLLHSGIEYAPIKYFTFRLGVDQIPSEIDIETNLTLGLGLNYAGFSFDYAYHPYNQMSDNDTHYFSLSYDPKDKQTTDYGKKAHIKILTPPDKHVTTNYKIEIKGKIIDSAVAKVYINGEEVVVNKDGEFSKELGLRFGKNISKVISKDKHGNTLDEISLRQLRLISFSDVEDNY